jgi:hypothetical protein
MQKIELDTAKDDSGDYDMKMLPEKRHTWLLLLVVLSLLIIVIYRVGFHFPVPALNGEAVLNLLQ